MTYWNVQNLEKIENRHIPQFRQEKSKAFLCLNHLVQKLEDNPQLSSKIRKISEEIFLKYEAKASNKAFFSPFLYKILKCLPFTYDYKVNKIFHRIQSALFPEEKLSQADLDESLKKIWKVLAQKIDDPSIKGEMSPDEIREWLPLHSEIIGTIQELDLTHLNLKVLPPEIAFFTQVRQLYLNNNHLKVLPSVINNLKELRKLQLYHNRLQTLSLQELPNLKEIHLGSNRLKTIPQSILMLPQLKKLNVELNWIEELPVFPKLSLKSLNLSWNKIQNISLEHIKNLESLKEFHFQNNPFNSSSFEILKCFSSHLLKSHL